MVDGDTLEVCEESEDAGAVCSGIAPYPAEEFDVDALTAALREVRARAVAVARYALVDPPEAYRARHVQEHDCVGALEALVPTRGLFGKEVAFEDPAVSGGRGGEFAPCVDSRRRRPFFSPEDWIEMHDGQARALGQLDGDRRLASTGWSDDDDAFDPIRLRRPAG